MGYTLSYLPCQPFLKKAVEEIHFLTYNPTLERQITTMKNNMRVRAITGKEFFLFLQPCLMWIGLADFERITTSLEPLLELAVGLIQPSLEGDMIKICQKTNSPDNRYRLAIKEEMEKSLLISMLLFLVSLFYDFLSFRNHGLLSMLKRRNEIQQDLEL